MGEAKSLILPLFDFTQDQQVLKSAFMNMYLQDWT